MRRFSRERCNSRNNCASKVTAASPRHPLPCESSSPADAGVGVSGLCSWNQSPTLDKGDAGPFRLDLVQPLVVKVVPADLEPRVPHQEIATDGRRSLTAVCMGSSWVSPFRTRAGAIAPRSPATWPAFPIIVQTYYHRSATGSHARGSLFAPWPRSTRLWSCRGL